MSSAARISLTSARNMALVKALNLEPMNLSCLQSEARFDNDGPEQAARHLEFRTTRDGLAYTWKEFVNFFGMPYAAGAWRRARLATQKEKDEALLRRVRLVLEKTKIKQVLPALSQSLAGDGSVERILAYAFPDAAAILPDVQWASRDLVLPHGGRVADSSVSAQISLRSSSEGVTSEGQSNTESSS